MDECGTIIEQVKCSKCGFMFNYYYSTCRGDFYLNAICPNCETPNEGIRE